MTELFGIGVICLALIAGTYLVLNQETHILGIKMCERPLSSPALLLFYGMLAGVSDPARKLSDIFGIVQTGNAAAERLFPLIDREPRITDPAQPQSPPRPHGRLVFENVSFHYRTGAPGAARRQFRNSIWRNRRHRRTQRLRKNDTDQSVAAVLRSRGREHPLRRHRPAGNAIAQICGNGLESCPR